MPWHIGSSDTCPASKPYSVIKDSTGESVGCHATEGEAKKHLAALYANEPRERPMTFDAVRSESRAPEFRSEDAEPDSLGTMVGHFSTFNDWYRVDSSWEGTFLERIAPGAWQDSIRSDLGDVRVLFDHGFDPQLGNKVLGPIRSLREDTRGAAYEVPLFDTSYNRDLLPGLKSGVYGSSMRFEVEDDTWLKKPQRSEHNPEGLPERTIVRSRVKEFGPVTFPANNKATAGVRSGTDTYYERLRRVDKAAYAGAVRARLSVVRAAGDGGDTMANTDRAMLTRCVGWMNSIEALLDEAHTVLDPYMGNTPDMAEAAEENEDLMAARGRITSGQLRARERDMELRVLGIIR